MNLKKWALIAEVTGGIAIVLSLIFVGIEVRQSSEAQLQGSTQAVVSEYNAGVRLISTDRELACIYGLGMEDIESLAGLEQIRFSAYLLSVVNALQQMHTLNAQGSIDTAVWSGFESQMREIVSYPGFRQWFAVRRHWYSADFQAYADSLRNESQTITPTFSAGKACASMRRQTSE